MYEFYRLRLICFLLVSFWQCIECRENNGNLYRFERIQGSDAIQVTRCDIICFNKKEKKECRKACMKEPFEKYGKCPNTFENMPVFVGACVYFCSVDSDCPAVEKCCAHSCGQTCMPATGLGSEQNLPPIPTNLVVKERNKKRNMVHISWDSVFNAEDQLILFVLEERHHLGKYYNKPLLGEWRPVHSTRNKFFNLKNVTKPGYWYQFRVAAVNSKGSRGFSNESEGFQMSQRPKLEKPTRLRVEHVKEKNGTIWGLIKWSPSKSSFPVQKYKITWSHRLESSDINYNSETVLVQRAFVPENQFYYRLKNLKKNLDYFIQVQAMSVFGKNSLKSEMAKMIFKTSKLEDQFEIKDFD